MEKKEYLAPRVETVIYGADLMQHEVITTSPTPIGEQEAKEANEFIEEESLPVDNNIWEDDEE